VFAKEVAINVPIEPTPNIEIRMNSPH